MAKIALLLLDLDGVIVLEMAPPHVEKLELICLHDLLLNALAAIDIPVVVLTHRSRAEAAIILRSAGVETGVVGLMAAEDILRAALTHGGPWQLMRKGLRKSWVLPTIERRYHVARKDVAFIDDRLDNIQDLLAKGIGLAMHAPSEVRSDGGLVSFDFDQVVNVLRHWDGKPEPTMVSIAPRFVLASQWNRTGLSTGTLTTSPFNQVRWLARSLRNLLRRRPAI